MTFNPAQPFTLTAVTSGGVGGKGTFVKVQRKGMDYFVTSNVRPDNPPILVSKKNAAVLEMVLKNTHFLSLPTDDGSAGYDLSIWSITLVQANAEWRLSIRTDRVTHSPFGGLYAALNTIVAELAGV